MKFSPISRRFFLQGLGGSILGLPFLESLIPRAYAQSGSASPMTRFICLCQANGTYKPDWYPDPSNLSRMTMMGNTHREMRLTDVQGPAAGAVSQLIGPEFANFRSKMLLLQNLHSLYPNLRGHQQATVLAGNIGRGHVGLWDQQPDPKYFGPSIDQVLAASNKIYPAQPMQRSVHMRSQLLAAEPEIDLSWDYRNGKMEFPERLTTPSQAFTTIFGMSMAPAPGTKENLLVDQVLEQFKILKNNPRITANDKVILDDHMAMVSQLQTQVQTLACSTPQPSRTYNDGSATDRGPLLDMYIQLLVAAIKCGATRVATLTLARGVDDLNFDSILGFVTNTGWHDYGHTPANAASANMRKIHRFYIQKYASLLSQLDTPEPGTNGTYLDNSIVYLANEQADHDHSYETRPILIAGSGGGALQTNKYIDYSPSPRSAQNYNRLLVTFLQAMGLQQSDYYTADMQARGILPGFGDDRGGDSTRALPLPGVLKAA